MTDVTAPIPAPALAPRGRPRRRGYLFPMLLILVGVFVFLGDLGYLPPISWRGVLSLWPLLMVVGGIELIVARRQPLVALALEIGVVALGIALVATQPHSLLAPIFGAPAGSSLSVPRGSARAMQLDVEGGAGTYTIRGGASALVDARSDGGEIAARDDRRGDVADVRVQPANVGGIFGSGGQPPTNVDVRIASDVPTTLHVGGGAGDFTVDLRNMRIQEARIDTGAARLELTLPTPSGDVPVRVGAGAATITVVVPDGVEARIQTTGALLSLSSLNPRLGSGSTASFAGPTGSLETAGYAAAKDRVTVTISAGATSITIR